MESGANPEVVAQSQDEPFLPTELLENILREQTTRRLLRMRQVSHLFFSLASAELLERQNKRDKPHNIKPFKAEFFRQWNLEQPVATLQSGTLAKSLQGLNLSALDRMNGLNVMAANEDIRLSIAEDDFKFLVDTGLIYLPTNYQSELALAAFARHYSESQRGSLLGTMISHCKRKHHVSPAEEKIFFSLVRYLTDPQKTEFLEFIKEAADAICGTCHNSGRELAVKIMPLFAPFKSHTRLCEEIIALLIRWGFKAIHLSRNEVVEEMQKSPTLVAFYQPYLTGDQRAILKAATPKKLSFKASMDKLAVGWMEWNGTLLALAIDYAERTQSERDEITAVTLEKLRDADWRSKEEAVKALKYQWEYLTPDKVGEMQDAIADIFRVVPDPSEIDATKYDDYDPICKLLRLIGSLKGSMHRLPALQKLLANIVEVFINSQNQAICNAASHAFASVRFYVDSAQIARFHLIAKRMHQHAHWHMRHHGIALWAGISHGLDQVQHREVFSALEKSLDDSSQEVQEQALACLPFFVEGAEEQSLLGLFSNLRTRLIERSVRPDNTIAAELRFLGYLLPLKPMQQEQMLSLLMGGLQRNSEHPVRAAFISLYYLKRYLTPAQLNDILPAILRVLNSNDPVRELAMNFVSSLIVRGEVTSQQLIACNIRSYSGGLLLLHTALLTEALNSPAEENLETTVANRFLFFTPREQPQPQIPVVEEVKQETTSDFII